MPRGKKSSGKASGSRQKGFSLTKAHGQHLLKNPLVIKSIIDKSEIKHTDVILEIGPGTGNLTVAMLEKARKVIAIEIDPRMVTELRKRVSSMPHIRDKLTIIHGDFASMPLDKLPKFDMCISNCPYNISSKIVFKLLSIHPPPRKHVLMFQLEFAQSMAAEPGQAQYSRLTVNTKLLAKTKILIKVSRNSFRPPPQVDSAVIEVRPLPKPEGLNLDEWHGFIRVLFSKKNKTIGAIFKSKPLLKDLAFNYQTLVSLGHIVPDPRPFREVVLGALGEMAGERPAKLRVPDLLRLMHQLSQKGIRFSE
eukprot:gnl/Dysnectes_brevis/1215_a1358_2779.p1 GENE.gnl/Dysnectes_brevis/1215_a1358_2779~~gnl/Dysnectes_brevis/1215_a1358_2779.p1  ORF type:complete len:307 (-),score=105.75 gnl/Dysnectes_brevis/1215_a1358_2779:32-952(-)